MFRRMVSARFCFEASGIEPSHSRFIRNLRSEYASLCTEPRKVRRTCTQHTTSVKICEHVRTLCHRRD